MTICDVDHFKRINDEYGHERGDQILRDVSYVMRKSLRSSEPLYRLGGDEFPVLVPGVGPSNGVEIAEGMRSAACEPSSPAARRDTLGPRRVLRTPHPPATAVGASRQATRTDKAPSTRRLRLTGDQSARSVGTPVTTSSIPAVWTTSSITGSTTSAEAPAQLLHANGPTPSAGNRPMTRQIASSW
jgi:GGDEF domain-containing protein